MTQAENAASAEPPSPSIYARLSPAPTQEGPLGLRFDFNEGARVLLPPREGTTWRVRLADADTGNVLFDTEMKSGLVRSAKRWFVRFHVEVWERQDEASEWLSVFAHDYDARGREILIQFPVGTIGDSIAWFSHACRFSERWPGAKVVCTMGEAVIPLFADAYPEITFLTREEAEAQNLPERAYATYYLGLFFTDAANDWQPVDFRHVGLHKTAAYILGLEPVEQAPRMRLADETRPIPERYVCIAVQATTASKMWNNPGGWREIVKRLNGLGYRVICIDQKPMHGQNLFWNQIPHGCEDQTGMTLPQMARWLRHADLFVGLSSGLAWLAWAAGAPVVLISGFTWPTNEFATPGRVINWHTCTGCWNDPGLTFDPKDFMWCPRHAGTPRQFECTRLITAAHVAGAIERVLGAARVGETQAVAAQ
jgi:autotransporter strand-loop-strand O-heptosyltransferase